MYIAILALCLNTCNFFYSNELYSSKDDCIKSIYLATKDLPSKIKEDLQVMCVPVNLGKTV